MGTGADLKLTDFYSRQIPALGMAAMERLRHKTLAVVGLGGLGSHSLMSLATYGFKEIRLIDGDEVALHNLHRQPLYDLAQERQKKAKVAQDFYKNRNPFTQFKAVPEFITTENCDEILQGVDLILDGADSHECSQILNEYSVIQKIPLVSASVERQSGYVGLFNGGYKDQPCLACLFAELPLEAPTCSELGVDPLAVSLTAQIQANLAARYLLGEEKAGRVYQISVNPLRIIPLQIAQNYDCTICSKMRDIYQKGVRAMDFKIIEEDEAECLIDVREKDEFQAKPRNAKNIPMQEIFVKPDLIPQQDITLCCKAGVRCRQVAEFLVETGFDHDITLLNHA